MDHKQFLSSLHQNDRARLTALSNRKGLAHLSVHALAIAMCTALIVVKAPFWQFLLPVQGILLNFLFCPFHETSHKTAFRSEWLNSLIGHICGFTILQSAIWFRFFHLAHHRHTQVQGKDPELDSEKPQTWQAYVWHVSGLPMWIALVATLVRCARGKSDDVFIPNARRDAVTQEARMYLLGYALLLVVSVVAGSAVLLSVWIIPMILGQPFLRLYLLAEHGRCPYVSNMFENTRTTFTNRLVRRIAWNSSFHIEHHSYPSVPFHSLPALNALMADHLAITADGYVGFQKDYVRTFGDGVT
ncbi:fatty acid desaturase [Tateyamaria sp. SN3-11]|uniref:fatty acid desaturase n=1 Tax=Tateyamaria sp. SN3-11 TaxID=3092147 RepID=UPI0039E9678C